MPSPAGSDRFFNAGVYGANDGLTTIQVWPRLAGHSPYFRNGQPSEGAVQHKVRERRSMTVQQRCLDNLFLTRDNPHLLLACRISEEAAGKRARACEISKEWRRRAKAQAARQQQVGGLQLLAIEDSSPSP